MKTVPELKNEIEQLRVKAAAIAQLARDEKREPSKEEVAEIDRIQGVGESTGVIGQLEEQLVRAEKLEKLMAQSAIKKVQNAPQREGQPVIKVKPIAGKLKSFKGQDAEHDAWVSGHYFAAALYGNDNSKQWLAERGYQVKNAHSTGDNSKGGYVVPQETAATIIRLVEDFGVFRRNIGTVFPIANGSLQVPKRAGGFTVRHPGENQEIVESDASFSMVELTPHKAAILTKLSSELNEDALPLLADFLVNEFAYAFAVDEDTCGFRGDGSLASNRITGLESALNTGAIAIATSETSFGALTMASFLKAMAQVKQYPGMRPAWYIHSAGYHASMARLKAASGGNAINDLQMGFNAEFLGFPVIFTQVLPSTLATNSNAKVAYFGDLSLACAMGDSRLVTIASSTERYFENDQIGVRATQRYDIQVHDRGTASEGAAVVALQLG
jgi:HK97 family phage major capsid protein